MDIKKKKYKFVEPPGIYELGLSFAKKFCVTAVIYALGYYQVNPGWLVGPIILIVLREQWRRTRDAERELAKAAATDEEPDIILARLGELPSWVTFPDVERAEWLNQIIGQLWPTINNYTHDLVISVIEPILRKTIAKKYNMGSFRFERILLGELPLRIRGVKVYDSKRTERNEIVMDLDVIYAGDCDFRFSIAKMRAGIRDLQLSGTVRLILKPLINDIPLIGGLQYFFLNPPSLDFNLVGLAGIFDLPGLSDLLRRTVQEKISAIMVLPKKMFVQLSKAAIFHDTWEAEPQGVVRICVVEARNLIRKDVSILGSGKNDAYVVLNIGARHFKTKVASSSVNPKWDFNCEVLVEEMGQSLNLTVYDHDDAPRDDECIGRASFDLNMVRREGEMDLWLDLEDVTAGQIHVKLTWLGLSENPALLKEAMESALNYGLATALLTVRMDSAEKLPHGKDGSKPDPYAILSVGKKHQETARLEKTDSPVFEETFHFLLKNPLTDSLKIQMMDRKNGELGHLRQTFDTILARPQMTMGKESLILNEGSDARVVVDMRLRILQIRAKEEREEDENENEEVEAATGDVKQPLLSGTPVLQPREPCAEAIGPLAQDFAEVGKELDSPIKPEMIAEPDDMKIRLTIRYSAEMQILLVTVMMVHGLPIDDSGPPDPYVKMYILPEKSEKHKTETQKDQTDPVYEERFQFPVRDLRGKTLHVQVCDRKFLKKSPKMGQVYIPLDDFDTGIPVTNWYPLDYSM